MTQGLIIVGDVLDGLARLDDNSVDVVVTDPPYELAFMGSKWDATGVAFRQETWEACLRVLKPGGHLIAFGGTRTHHRMWCAIEDAGFEVRDMLTWMYGTGFPKSLDVSKAIDKAAGAERKVIGVNPHHRPRSHMEENTWRQAEGRGASPMSSPDLTTPATDEAKQWEGYGTALKPAVEPILLARKPLSEPTVAVNVLKWGTGALAIDATRIGTEKITQHGRDDSENRAMSGRNYAEPAGREWVGRWPANVIFECTCDDPQPLPEKARERKGEPTQSKLYKDAGATNFAAKPGAVRREGGGFVHQPDCPAGMLDAQSGKLHAPVSSGRKGAASASGFLGELGAQSQERNYDDSGGASRFFFTARSSQDELLLCRAKAIMEAWNPDLANTVDSSSCLSSEAVVSALSDAVVVASCGEMRVNECQVPSTGATPSALRRLCENAIILTLSTEPKSLPASFRIDTVPSKVSRAKRAARKKPTGTTTTTPSRTSSDGYAVVVTLATIGSSTEAGAAGSATRFRYAAKASRAERERGLEDFEPVTGAEAVNRKPDTAGLKSPRAGAGRSAKEIRNTHNTVKPIALMRWLVRLVTPPGGLVLDPFCGSGSTLIAAREEGHDFVGIDLSPEYCRIAEARVGGAELVAVETSEDTDPEWEE
jgi:DNA modification methylase